MVKIEDKLIRYSSRTNINLPWQSGVSGILNPRLNWAYFLKKAQRDNLSPLIYKSLLKIPAAKNIVPPGIWQSLKDSYYSCLSQNISGLRQLEEIVENFQKEKIEIILFKGLTLAELIYGDLGLRPCQDIDIMVRKEDFLKADKVLRNLGFYTHFNLKNFGEIRFSNYLYFPIKKIQTTVHLYWHLINSPYHSRVCWSIDIDKLWLKAQPIKLGKAGLCTFSPEHSIIYLSMHALKHSFFPLILLCDINEFLRVRKEKIDWDGLIREGFRFNLTKQIFYSLYLAKELFGADIPGEALSKLRPRKMGIFERQLISSVLKGKSIFNAEGLIYFGMNETWKDKFSFLRRALFPPKLELALIRQKEVRAINIFDYIRRLHLGLSHSTQALFNWLA